MFLSCLNSVHSSIYVFIISLCFIWRKDLRKVFHFQSERELMKSIIPEQSQSSIFDKLIQAAMEIFISDGEVLSPKFCIH